MHKYLFHLLANIFFMVTLLSPVQAMDSGNEGDIVEITQLLKLESELKTKRETLYKELENKTVSIALKFEEGKPSYYKSRPYNDLDAKGWRLCTLKATNIAGFFYSFTDQEGIWIITGPAIIVSKPSEVKVNQNKGGGWHDIVCKEEDYPSIVNLLHQIKLCGGDEIDFSRYLLNKKSFPSRLCLQEDQQ